MSQRNVPFYKRFPKKQTATEQRAAGAKVAAKAHRGRMVAARRAPKRDRLGENKYFDTAVFSNTNVGSDLAASSLVTDLAIVPQGLTVNSRVGKKLRVLRVQLKGNVYVAPQLASGGNGPTFVRCALIWDREPDKAALVPATTDIWISNDSSALTNRDNAPRFKILREWTYCLPVFATAAAAATASTSGGDSQQQLFEYIDLSKKDLEIIWTKADTTGATANKVKGNLLFALTSDNTKAGGATYMTLNTRVDYEDEASKQ